LAYYDVDDEMDNRILMVYYHVEHLLINDVYDDVDEFYEDYLLLMKGDLMEWISLSELELFQLQVNF
jgi:hypothetical protein